MEKIISTKPLVRTARNFVTPEECQQIIAAAKDSMKPGHVVDQNGGVVVDTFYRDAETTMLKAETFPLGEEILHRISQYTGYPRSCFESFTVTHYNKGDYFKNHQDYFTWHPDPEVRAQNDKRAHKGGNRISTVLLYLNDVEAGGETYFPWIDAIVKPETGKLVQFDYGYQDWVANISSQHAAIPVIKGDKWIVSIWIREQSCDTVVETYKDFREESEVFRRLENGYFELEVGPEYDRRKIALVLPANEDIQNTLVVGFTGGMDSALLLYLLASLNSYQQIPYKIQPVCVTGYNHEGSEHSIREDWTNLEHMLSVIRDMVDCPIRNVKYLGAPVNSKPENHVSDGLLGYWVYSEKNGFERLKDFYKHKFIFTGCTEMPTDDDPRWANMYTRHTSPLEFWKQPFINLQKYHILDAIYQLGLEEILENTQLRCGKNHPDLYEACDYFACNERRWAFSKLGLFADGDKYCITGRNEHGSFRD